MALSLRQRQIDAIVRMLNLNVTTMAAGDDEEVYKVLVLDKFCCDVVSPLLRLAELRKYGVTLALMLDVDREPVPDVPAIYLLQPTEAAVARVVRDAAAGLYETMHLNFCSPLPKPLMEQLASGAVASDCLPRLASVFDQHLAYVALEPRLFTLMLPTTYVRLNDPSARDADVEAEVEAVAAGLFGVLVTLGAVPYIRCARGGAAEMAAGRIADKVRAALAAPGRANPFAEGVGAAAGGASGRESTPSGRPLLLLLDRSVDLTAPLQHPWAYAPLVHDVLGARLNRVVLGGGDATGGGGGAHSAALSAKRSYELDEGDPFWAANANSPFPKVAEEVEAHLARYKRGVEDVNRRAEGGLAVDGTGGPHAPSSSGPDGFFSTHGLVAAVASLPELTRAKKVIDKHTTLATALLGAIKARGLDAYTGLEEDLLLGRGDRAAVLTLLADKAKGSAADKHRLALIALLSSESSPAAVEVETIEAALRDGGAGGSPAVAHVRRAHALHKSLTAVGVGGGGGTGGGTGGPQGNILDLADKLYTQGMNAVAKGVQSLLVGGRTLPIARAAEPLIEGRGGGDADGYALYDPRSPRPGPVAVGAGADTSRGRGPFREAIVFVVGGGCYLEHLGLQEYAAAAQPPRTVVYGCTELLTGAQFLEQLADLGRKGA